MADTKLLKAQAEAGRKADQMGQTSGSGQKTEPEKSPVSENWAEETIADLDDFIESQGIYIRQ